MCREQHAHLLVDSMQFVEHSEDQERGTLKVSGYVRGRALSVNCLVHIPGLGDFQMTQIDAIRDPTPITPKRAASTVMAMVRKCIIGQSSPGTIQVRDNTQLEQLLMQKR